MNKSLVFKRAWIAHNIKIKHNISSNFGESLSRCFKIAKIMGDNYKEQPTDN